jgi:hypothetical protein
VLDDAIAKRGHAAILLLLDSCLVGSRDPANIDWGYRHSQAELDYSCLDEGGGAFL